MHHAVRHARRARGEQDRAAGLWIAQPCESLDPVTDVGGSRGQPTPAITAEPSRRHGPARSDIDRDSGGHIPGREGPDGTGEDDAPRSQPVEVGLVVIPRCIGVQRDMDDAGQQAGKVDEDPVGRVWADVGDAITAIETRRDDRVGEFHCRGDKLAPHPRAGFAGVAGRKAVDDGGAVKGIARPRGHEIDERRHCLSARRWRSLALHRHNGIHRPTRSKRTAIPWPRPMHIVARP